MLITVECKNLVLLLRHEWLLLNCTMTIGNILFLFFSRGAISLKLHTSNVGVYCVSSANFSPTDYKKVWRTRSDTDISLVK